MVLNSPSGQVQQICVLGSDTGKPIHLEADNSKHTETHLNSFSLFQLVIV